MPRERRGGVVLLGKRVPISPQNKKTHARSQHNHFSVNHQSEKSSEKKNPLIINQRNRTQ